MVGLCEQGRSPGVRCSQEAAAGCAGGGGGADLFFHSNLVRTERAPQILLQSILRLALSNQPLCPVPKGTPQISASPDWEANTRALGDRPQVNHS